MERRVRNGEVTIHLADGPPVVADELLVATGRVPASGGLGLVTVGLTPGSPVQVDDSMRSATSMGVPCSLTWASIRAACVGT
ncbi:hypothetical protein Pmi06nite_69320 [Planotetraspora mira]|uniref:FAD/NAD(P)-binding domain-containing protein n=1 Tax=Planotetraspora mira TaxID=58121 RepID=A0A8J3TV35_9ACTN|nr:hypothetical protein Pmi06nite_69320 [Planotetraspora mira]